MAPEALKNACVCLVVPCLAGLIIGGVLFSQGSNRDEFDAALLTMNPTNDFESVSGGCIITASNYTEHSYYSGSSTCYSQCSAPESACSERYVHGITVVSDGSTYASAPEDSCLSGTDTCQWLTMPSTPFASSLTVGASVPCWRATSPTTLTRNTNLPSDPRSSSYDCLTACGETCNSKVGFACGNDACVTIVDPAEQLAFYQGYTPPDHQTRNIAILATSGGVLLLIFCFIAGDILYQKFYGDDDSSDEEDDPSAAKSAPPEGDAPADKATPLDA